MHPPRHMHGGIYLGARYLMDDDRIGMLSSGASPLSSPPSLRRCSVPLILTRHLRQVPNNAGMRCCYIADSQIRVVVAELLPALSGCVQFTSGDPAAVLSVWWLTLSTEVPRDNKR